MRRWGMERPWVAELRDESRLSSLSDCLQATRQSELLVVRLVAIGTSSLRVYRGRFEEASDLKGGHRLL
jgi:hypothetical protein